MSNEDVYLLKPLNTAEPTADEKRHSQDLEEFLKSKGLFESQDEALQREEVLGLFYEITQRWIRGVAARRGYSAEDARAHVFTFGSYRLGVHGPGADMDTLVVGPRYATRDGDFFGTEKHCLQHILAETPEVTDLAPVPDAFVPVIGIKYKGIQIDVLYASLQIVSLPEHLDLSNHSLLRGCDEPTVRSLNGCRVTDTILKLVPRQDSFRLALRAVKFWASLRGIASNVTGYLGGVNLAIMVAKVCQLYPRAEASTVLIKFFILLKQWPWPRAIHLKVPEDHSLGLPVWDPRPGMRDSLALMPVITPAYPAMNSLYNVQRCTLEVMTQEFVGAAEVCTHFLLTPPGRRLDWARLFTPVAFFSNHQFYIQLEVSADTEHDLTLWDGWVGSRLRRLVINLQDHVNVRPFPKAKKPPQEPKDGRPHLFYYVGVDKKTVAALTASQLLPNGQVMQLPLHAQQPTAAPAGKVDLKQPTVIFINEVTAWQAKKPGMELKVGVLKKQLLPHWVFDDGVNPHAPAPKRVAEAQPEVKEEPGVKRERSEEAEASRDASSSGGAAEPAAKRSKPDVKVEPPGPGIKRERSEEADVSLGGTSSGGGAAEPTAKHAKQQEGTPEVGPSGQGSGAAATEAKAATEEAAMHKQQLQSRDVGDWIAVDQGVSLAGAEAAKDDTAG